MTGTGNPTVTARELHEILGSGAEFALIDVRDAALTAAEGSILLAVSVPLSVLELRIAALVPRRGTPIIVYDGGGDGRAERGARRLRELGYTEVTVLENGLTGWAAAGYKVQSGGDNVIGQAFGEFVEEQYGTPHITVADYLRRRADGEDIVLLDSRPLPEFEAHSLPGGTSIPGAELVYRAGNIVTSPDTLVVVNCAGRTRSILGAQTLINAGLPNRVVALEGGTQSWVLEGHELDHGRRESVAAPAGTALHTATDRARRIADRFGIRHIDHATLEQFRAEQDSRSLYLLDVRTPEEFAAGHLRGSSSAPSWDVAPWVFRHVATHNARIVLVDNDTVRATVAASWIVQLGWGEVFVLDDALSETESEIGPVAPTVLGLPDHEPESITPTDLRDTGSSDDLVIIDLAPSPAYRAGHLPGAHFAIRARLGDTLGDIPATATIVLTSEDGVLARLAAADLATLTERPVRVLRGGTAAWRESGLPLESGTEQWLHPAEDVVPSGWRETDPERRQAGFRRYLSWELGLVAELRADDTVPFRTFEPATS